MFIKIQDQLLNVSHIKAIKERVSNNIDMVFDTPSETEAVSWDIIVIFGNKNKLVFRFFSEKQYHKEYQRLCEALLGAEPLGLQDVERSQYSEKEGENYRKYHMYRW